MIDNPETNTDNNTERPHQLDEIHVWASWLRQAKAISSDILELLLLEVQLAISDSKRLVVLALLFVPLLMLTWLGFSVLLAWLVYLLNTSVTQGLLAFLIIQVLSLGAIVMGWNHYKRSLTLPLTRQHIRRIVEGQSNDT